MRLPTLLALFPAVAALTAAAQTGVPAMPMPIDLSRSASQRWLQKPVLQSRLLDDMENPANWAHSGPGQLAFSTERFRDGKQSIRVTARTTGDRPSPSGRPWGEAVLRRKVNGEDWAAFNRISVWVFPTMPNHKIGSVCLKLFNDGVEKHPQSATRGPLHYALVTPGQWNHIVWEIAHLSRDKVTALELIYRQQGSEPGAAPQVSFDWDHLELQRVEPDYFEGWAVAPGRLAFSHTGYERTRPKTALASNLAAAEFQLVDAGSGQVVFTAPAQTVDSPLGKFQRLDFSPVTRAGRYILKAGALRSAPFPIADNIWRDTLWKTINFFYCERCGDRIPGIHDLCHADWQAEHNGQRITINGGWHDAGDLSQGLINTGEATHAMLTLAQRRAISDPVLSQRLLEEAAWGVDWLHKTRFGDGFRVTWATMDYWTDGQLGTVDDTRGDVRNNATDNFVGASASALASVVLKPTNPPFAEKSLAIARADWRFALENMRGDNVEMLSAGVLAGVELFRATGDRAYASKAAELARPIVASQERSIPDWTHPLTGFFYTSPRKDRILNYMHRGHDQAPVVALAALCESLPEHADWPQWYSAIALHSEYLLAASRFQEPWGLLPAGIYKLTDRPEQTSRGLKLSDTHALRRFPVWFDMRGHYGILLSQTKALAAAARLRNRPDLADLCQLQLQWVVGRNPFAQSTMYGEGYDYAPQYTAMSGDMVGSLPVGIQTKLNEDVPFWPMTNCWNYKEVWVHPSSRWLFTLADLAGGSRPALPRPVAQGPADKEFKILLSLPQPNSAKLTLRGANLVISNPQPLFETIPGALHRAVWSVRIADPALPWVAIVVPEDDPTRCVDLVGNLRGAAPPPAGR